MQAEETIPADLQPAADAAVAWINDTENRNFELTGLVDYDGALAAEGMQSFEMGLVLCDGEICTREQVHFEPSGSGFNFSLVDAAASDVPPLLDPPPGLRSQWLTEAIAKHEFVLLLFYRGLW